MPHPLLLTRAVLRRYGEEAGSEELMRRLNEERGAEAAGAAAAAAEQANAAAKRTQGKAERESNAVAVNKFRAVAGNPAAVSSDAALKQAVERGA